MRRDINVAYGQVNHVGAHGIVSCPRPCVGQSNTFGAYQSRAFIPMSVISSHRRNSVAWCTIRPRRPHSWQREPFLKGLTARCSSLFRFLNQNRVIFIPFMRSIPRSNFRLLAGFFLPVDTNLQRKLGPCLHMKSSHYINLK